MPITTNQNEKQIEHIIAGSLVRCFLARGYDVRITSINGFEHWHVATDIYLTGTAKTIGWVQTCYGNGAEFIIDYTAHLEEIIKPARDLAKQYL